MASTLEQQLGFYLTDLHAIELQALAQLKRAGKVAGDSEIAAAFEDHARETEGHERAIRARLDALSWRPVPQKDIAGKATGVGMALFARLQPDSPGKLVAHAYSYERMELAAYDLLARVAERAGDEETTLAARMIEREERAMAERLAAFTERAVEASLHELGTDDVGKQLTKYLADAHAIEEQATRLLRSAPKLAGAEDLASAFEEHLSETKRHSALVEERLRARGASPSSIKDAALRLGAMNLGMFLKAQQDTPAKLAAFAYAFEHLEIAAYELLKRIAARAGDEATASASDTILLEERATAARIHGLFNEALEASLEEAGVST
jgi:ferritin-like metal-binding protein YciE